MKITYPAIIRWNNFDQTKYEATKNANGGIDLKDTVKGTLYPNNFRTEDSMVDLIKEGTIKLVSQAEETASLTITVDTSQLAGTLAMAKELEATMLRIKAMFAS